MDSRLIIALEDFPEEGRYLEGDIDGAVFDLGNDDILPAGPLHYAFDAQLYEHELVLRGSVAFAYDFIAEHFKGVTLERPQGTYLLYLDCTEYLKASGRTMDELLKAGYECGVYWQDGRTFFCDNTIRMNLALPRALVEEAFARLKKYVF